MRTRQALVAGGYVRQDWGIAYMVVVHGHLRLVGVQPCLLAFLALALLSAFAFVVELPTTFPVAFSTILYGLAPLPFLTVTGMAHLRLSLLYTLQLR